jgi:hypothetical protein
VEVAWNDVRNEPRRSRVEDVINVYQSSGTPASPILIRHNFINGAYPTRPASNPYSGGGIMVGDGGGDGKAPAYVTARQNVVLNTTNYGIGVAAGAHMRVVGNCVLSNGHLPNGTVVRAQNVGIYAISIYNQHKLRNVAIENNVVQWKHPKRGEVNNFYIPDAKGVTGNSSYPRPVTDVLTTKLYSTWRQQARKAGHEIGIRSS